MVTLGEKDGYTKLAPAKGTSTSTSAKRITTFLVLLAGVTYVLLGPLRATSPSCRLPGMLNDVVEGLQSEDGYSRNVSSCGGYDVVDTISTNSGMSISLEMVGKGCQAFGMDVKALTVEVSYETETRLHVHIFDTAQKHYQLPHSLWPRPSTSSSRGDLLFHHSSSPFAFWITRSSTSSILFDTRASSLRSHKDPIIVDGKDAEGTEMTSFPLVFEDKYLQIATSLPEDTNIYGLGEVAASSGFRRNSSNSLSTLFASDAGTPEDKSLYGSFPFYLETRWNATLSSSASHGVFLLNSHGMDILQRPGVLEYRLLGGTLDFYFFSGPTAKEVVQQYSEVTGKPALMPYWAFGFHLCRWGWRSLEETGEVVKEMWKAKIPLETIWNDIDYMNEYRDFETNEDFSHKEYKKFIKKLHKHHQHYVPIVDAAIAVTRNKTDTYDTYARGVELDVWTKNANNGTYIGRVWPGYSVFPDWTAKNIREFWHEAFANMSKIIDFDGIWLDMNEPASFCDGSCGSNVSAAELNNPSSLPWEKRDLPSGGEYSKADDPPYKIHNVNGPLGGHTVAPNALDSSGVPHLSTHNTWGYSQEVLTNQVLQDLKPGVRPFIVSRSTFPGSGRVTAHWLGDNYSTWKSMRNSIQGVLQFQMYQIPMIGPDTCGFSGNTTEELCIRWTQLSSFFPFMRNHNVIRAISQEPYQWESVAEVSRNVLATRYALLPYWLTLFAEAHSSGTPPLRSLHMEFDDPRFFGVSEQFMVGDALLVTPVLDKGATEVVGFFPSSSGTLWRDWNTHKILDNSGTDELKLKVPLMSMAVHQRSATVILTHAEPGYTLKQTRDGAFKLVVFLDEEGVARGRAVLDDGMSVPVVEQSVLSFVAGDGKLRITKTGNFDIESKLSQIIILGATSGIVQINGKSHHKVEQDEELLKITMEDLRLDLNEEVEVRWE